MRSRLAVAIRPAAFLSKSLAIAFGALLVAVGRHTVVGAWVVGVSWVDVSRCLMPSLVTPPGADVIPARDEQLREFAIAFGFAFANPPFATLGPEPTDLQDAADDFASKLATASAAATRTSVTIAAKNTSRATLVTLLRNAIRYASTAFRFGQVTEAQLATLGLRPPDPPSPINAPTDAPLVDVVSVSPDVVRMRVNQVVNGEAVTLRRFPYGVVGVEWRLVSSAASKVLSLNRVNAVVDTTDFADGAIVTATARYYTRRGLLGPVSAPITFPVLRGGE